MKQVLRALILFLVLVLAGCVPGIWNGEYEIEASKGDIKVSIKKKIGDQELEP